MLKRVLLAAAVTWCAGPALANDAQAKPQAPAEKLVCTYESTIGSNLKRRVCVTEAERDARREEDQRRMREMQDRSARPSSGGGH